MGKFEEQLLTDLMQEHGPELAAAERPNRRSTKPAWITTGIAVAGTAAAALVLLPAGEPAYAVTENSDGTVTVSLFKASAVDAVNKELADKRVDVQLGPDYTVSCISPSGSKQTTPDGSVDIPLEELVEHGVPTRIKIAKSPDGSFITTTLDCEWMRITGK